MINFRKQNKLPVLHWKRIDQKVQKYLTSIYRTRKSCTQGIENITIS